MDIYIVYLRKDTLVCSCSKKGICTLKFGGEVVTHDSVNDCNPMSENKQPKGFRWADGRRSLA